MGEDGGCGGVDGEAADGAVFYAAEEFDEAFEVHGLLEDVLHDFVDEGVVGDLDVADDGLEAGCGLGEDGGHEVFGAGALDLRGDAFAFGEAQELQAASGGPAPAVFEDGRGNGGLFEEFLCGVFGKEMEDVGEWEAVLLGEGDVDAVVGGGGLQLEVEAAAEAFAEGEAEGFVDAAAEGSVEDELHAAAVVEETLGDDGGFGGDGSEGCAAGDDVGDELVGSAGAEAALLHEPGCGRGHFRLSGGDVAGSDVGGEGGDLFAQFADSIGENCGTLRGFAFPERQSGRRAVGVFDEDAAGGFDALDAPAGGAEEDDVAGAGVDGEVLVECGDLDAFGLEDDAVEVCVGDGAAVGDGDHAGAAAGVEVVLDAVAEEVGTVAAAGGFDAFGEEGEDVVEGLAREVAVGVGAAKGVVEGVFFPGLGSAGCNDLLHEDVGGLRRNL